ncbi:hypothetical protein, partial [Pseudomonas sp. AH2 (2023)]|uniref:hypothetical protein n=1 Tax=Pseudomonas sp. AH2 (2023) TaxID=3048599 RepID=UPI002B2386FB
ELGVSLPADIEQKVNNFVNGLDSVEKLNPYMEWEVKVTAEFFSLEALNGWDVDGFYTKQYTSHMLDALPLPANAVYSDEEY